MKKLTKKALKELLEKIEGQLNKIEEWELENGYYIYKFELTKDNIVCNIMDDDDFIEYTMEIEKADSIIEILKGLINYLYANEINNRQAYLRGSKGYFNRKHKSLALWLDKDKQDKVNTIVEDIAKRYKESKSTEIEINHYKAFVSQFYSCLYILEPSWRMVEIKDAIFAKMQKLNIKNVSISYIEDRLIIMKLDDKAENVIDTFEIVIDSYGNKSAIINQVIVRLSEEKAA